MNAAAHGFGVAIGDCALVREDIAMKRLVMPFDKMLATGQSYYLAYPDCVAGQQKKYYSGIGWRSRCRALKLAEKPEVARPGLHASLATQGND